MGCDPTAVPTILLLRHAQASFGTADYDVLSDTGHRQAAAAHAGPAHPGIRPDRPGSSRPARPRNLHLPPGQRNTAPPFGHDRALWAGRRRPALERVRRLRHPERALGL